jgi:hypothetical protein
MPGALMQLVAYGAQDVYLSGNPQMTFFKTVYRRHTNFSMECIKQSFKGTVGAGQRVVATLARNGDLVHDCFLKVPSYTQAGDTERNPGHNMIEYIECEIGGQLIDKHFGHWMEVHAQLTEEYVMSLALGQVDPELGAHVAVGGFGHGLSRFQLTSMTGGVLGANGAQQLPDHYVPLRFWFCRHVGLALPLIALQYHEVNINIKFSSAGCFNCTGSPPSPSLWCNYIYLDTDERRRFAQVSHEYLIEQVQHQGFTTAASGNTLKLNFNHPVKELIWASLSGAATWGTAAGGNFAKIDASTVGDSTFQLKLNGHDRFEKQSTTYFTRYQPLKYHTGLSRGTTGGEGDAIAVYSFALKPEEHQPSGTCNFSRIDNSQLVCVGTFQTNLQLYAVNYNVLRIMSGMGGLAYSN